MHERTEQAAQAQQSAFNDYVMQGAATFGGGSADQLVKLVDLKTRVS